MSRGNKKNYHKNPFEAERLRASLASHKDYSALEKTYKEDSYQEINDLNLPEMWDSLNNRPNLNRSANPMGYHRLSIVSNLIFGNKKRVLNVGCGAGDLENILSLSGKLKKLDWLGIDISSRSINVLKKRFPKSNFKVKKVEKIKYDEVYFDYVIVLEVLEHIKPHQVLITLRQLNRVLKKGGELIVSVPLNEGLEEMIKQGKNPNAHVRIYTPDLIRAEIEIAGFKILKQKLLFAFNKYYLLKSFLVKFLPGFRQPNGIIIIAQKP